MTADPTPADLDRTTGEPVVWYLATCQDCDPRFPQPFRVEAERDVWADAHRTTGHTVTTTLGET